MVENKLSSESSAIAVAGIVALAGILGAAAGALFGWLDPPDSFSWAGLAVAPLWLLLEFYFEGVVVALGHRTTIARISSTIAVLVGFYVAWFAIRGFAPQQFVQADAASFRHQAWQEKLAMPGTSTTQRGLTQALGRS